MASRGYAPSDFGISVNRVFSRGFGVLKDNPATMFGIVFLFQALPSTLLNYLRASMQGPVVGLDSVLGLGVMSLCFTVLGLALMMIVQGGLVRATIAYSEGRRASLGESLAAGLEVALPLIGLTILLLLGLFVGFAFFFIPGVILAVMWSVAVPALVTERIGVVAAFGRSRALTKGARWKVFAIGLLTFVLLALLQSLFLSAVVAPVRIGMHTAISPAYTPGIAILGALTTTVTGAVSAAILTALYVELREWKEGASGTNLAEIFA